jgi:hypothetical protein
VTQSKRSTQTSSTGGAGVGKRDSSQVSLIASVVLSKIDATLSQYRQSRGESGAEDTTEEEANAR